MGYLTLPRYPSDPLPLPVVPMLCLLNVMFWLHVPIAVLGGVSFLFTKNRKCRP